MKKIAEHHDSLRNTGTYVYAGTKEEVDLKWKELDKSRKECEERGYRGYILTPMHPVSGRRMEFGVDWSGEGFMTNHGSPFQYVYYLIEDKLCFNAPTQR